MPHELGPPWKSVQAILTTSASIFLTPGKMSGWSGLLHAKSPYTLQQKVENFFPKKNNKNISWEQCQVMCGPLSYSYNILKIRNFHHDMTTCPHIFLSKCWRNVSGCVFWFIYFCFTFFATVKLDRPSLCVSWNTAAYQARPQCTSFWVCQVFFTTANFFLHL